ncbi:AAA family ATPase [Paenibacillus turpanensis]|uniref:AAA family ATPase n=1 Tax=Paenibacillus turpanensis TaxID=2689078 RepID=UPI00140BDC56|nr:AAA family ATPase [Paenibacillus turpanensis]
MERLLLAVADGDEDYVAALASFLRESELFFRFEVLEFTNWEKLAAFEAQQRSCELLVVSASLARAVERLPESAVIVALLDSPHEADQPEGSAAAIFKYQSLVELVNKLGNVYMSFRQQPMRQHGNGPGAGACTVVTFFAASGGTGKTTAAIYSAADLIKRGKRVLYINLESANCVSSYLSERTQSSVDLGRMLYHIRAVQPEQAMEAAAEGKVMERGIAYNRPLHVREWLELRADDIEGIVTAARASEAYDMVLLDLESGLSTVALAALQACDLTVWTCTGDAASEEKRRLCQRALEELQLWGQLKTKCMFLQTKRVPTAYPPASGNKHLPYMPQWKTSQSLEDVWQSPYYAEQAASLWGALLEDGDRDGPAVVREAVPGGRPH